MAERERGGAGDDKVAVIALVLFVALAAALLLIQYLRGKWIVDPSGTPLFTDFVPVFLAGREALHGNAAAVYDLASFRSLQHGFAVPDPGYYPWPYPPTFFLVLAPLAILPYAGAFAVWALLTLSALTLVVQRIVQRPWASLLVLGSPLTFADCWLGQNGLLTGALLGAALGLLENYPIAAGVALGGLTYKPQFGLLFPLVLVLTRRWRTFATATATALVMAAAATAFFGVSAWEAFPKALQDHSGSTFVVGDVAWVKLQTFYGAIRAAGGGATLAGIVQLAVSCAVTVIVCLAWCRPVPYALQAAMLAAGALLVTPYAFTYDLGAIAVPVAFLAKDCCERGAMRGEGTALRLLFIGFFLCFPGLPLIGLLPLGPVMLTGLLWFALRRTAFTGNDV